MHAAYTVKLVYKCTVQEIKPQASEPACSLSLVIAAFVEINSMHVAATLFICHVQWCHAIACWQSRWSADVACLTSSTPIADGRRPICQNHISKNTQPQLLYLLPSSHFRSLHAELPVSTIDVSLQRADFPGRCGRRPRAAPQLAHGVVKGLRARDIADMDLILQALRHRWTSLLLPHCIYTYSNLHCYLLCRLHVALISIKCHSFR